MPFCPKCRFEYEATVTVCPDCEEPLVSVLSPEGEIEFPDEIKDWVQLARLTSPQYAQMVQETLRSHGIPVVIQSGAGFFGETGQLGTSSFQPIGGGFSVYVPDEYVVAADIEGLAILGEVWIKSRLVDIEGAEDHAEEVQPDPIEDDQ